MGFLPPGTRLVRLGERPGRWWFLKDDWDAFEYVANASGMNTSGILREEYFRNVLALRGDFGMPKYIFHAKLVSRARCFYGRGKDKAAGRYGRGRLAQGGVFKADGMVPQIYIPNFSAVLKSGALVVEMQKISGI